MNQGSLFDIGNHDGNHTITPRARRTDPETSHEAAARANISPNRMLFLKTIAKQHIEKTAYQIAAYAVQFDGERTLKQIEKHRETVRKRAAELENGWKVKDESGAVHIVGKGLIRKVDTMYCPEQESNCTTYEITAKGKAWLRDLK